MSFYRLGSDGSFSHMSFTMPVKEMNKSQTHSMLLPSHLPANRYQDPCSLTAASRNSRASWQAAAPAHEKHNIAAALLLAAVRGSLQTSGWKLCLKVTAVIPKKLQNWSSHFSSPFLAFSTDAGLGTQRSLVTRAVTVSLLLCKSKTSWNSSYWTAFEFISRNYLQNSSSWLYLRNSIPTWSQGCSKASSIVKRLLGSTTNSFFTRSRAKIIRVKQSAT